MIPRRKIREAVIQLVYCTAFEGSAQNVDARDAFWTLLLEDSADKLAVAKAKALIHLSSGREVRVAALQKRVPEVDEHLKPLEQTEPLRTALKKLVAAENQWLADFQDIHRRLKSTSEAEKKTLPTIISDLLTNDAALTSRRHAIARQIEDFPTFRNQLEPIAATLRKLQNLSDRAQLLGDPDNYGKHPAVSHLRPALDDQQKLRKETEALANGLFRHQDEIDKYIANLAENYQPERINPVERSILRLGLYEILFLPDVPAPVAINEALEIAKAFGTEDSYRFVNGILDRVAKSLPETADDADTLPSDETPNTDLAS